MKGSDLKKDSGVKVWLNEAILFQCFFFGIRKFFY